jgi:glycerol-3-phosphate dehydrogenase subunit B
MDLSKDIVVIGGGWAGFSAALEARARGHQVLLIQKGPGATCFSAGSLDLADSPLRTSRDRLGENTSVEKNIHEIIRREHRHPYALLSEPMGEDSFQAFLNRAVQQVFAALPLTWSGNLKSNRRHPTSLGCLKSTAAVLNSMAEGDLLSMNQAKVLVVGLKGYAPMSSRFLREVLLEIQSQDPHHYLQFVGNTDVEVPGLEGRTSLRAYEIASRLDQEEGFVRFGQSILNYTKGKVYTHLLLPPVMGIVNHELIIMALRKITGLKVAEVLAAPMSIPGHRLDEAIHHGLESKEIDRMEGEVVGFDAHQSTVKSVYVHAGSHRAKIEAKAFVLATGKFIGGGIVDRPYFREALFHLPVFDGERGVKEVPASRLAASSFFSTQPLLKVGLQTNALLQPLGEEGEVAFTNVFAAGAVLGGFDAFRTHTGEGVAISTGCYAGQMASNLI